MRVAPETNKTAAHAEAHESPAFTIVVICFRASMFLAIRRDTSTKPPGLFSSSVENFGRACEKIVESPKTPKYGAIDILTWLMLTDPHVLTIRPVKLTMNILGQDVKQLNNCWKCLTIFGMAALFRHSPTLALKIFNEAEIVAKADTGAVPPWLASRATIAATEVAKHAR